MSTLWNLNCQCPTCAYGDLDLSIGLFLYFEDLSVGRFQMTWNWDDHNSNTSNDSSHTNTPNPNPNPNPNPPKPQPPPNSSPNHRQTRTRTRTSRTSSRSRTVKPDSTRVSQSHSQTSSISSISGSPILSTPVASPASMADPVVSPQVLTIANNAVLNLNNLIMQASRGRRWHRGSCRAYPCNFGTLRPRAASQPCYPC